MIKVLSLCDGIACGLIAFSSLGLQVDYHAVEIDPKPRAIADSNFGDKITRIENDVTKITKEIVMKNGPYDYVLFGSPCQSFSYAGDGTGLDGQSKLLIDCVRVLRWCQEFNPNLKFIIENVTMQNVFLARCNKLIGTKPMLIDSSRVSAQSRERLYWTNFKATRPEDKGIVLKDILEKEVPEKLFFTPRNLSAISDFSIRWDPKLDEKKSQQNRAYWVEGKAPCLMNSRTEDKAKIFGFTDRGKTLGDYIDESKQVVMLYYQFSPKHIESPIYFRRLTVRECARLQTIPEDFSFASASNTDAYNAIGNGWTVDVIKHLIRDSI